MKDKINKNSQPLLYVADYQSAQRLCDELGQRAQIIVLAIGGRGKLSDEQARAAAKQWKSAIARNYKYLSISIDGYDDDPRELFRIPEVCSYVKKFVLYAEITPELAVRLIPNSQGCGMLAACGAFGERYRRLALATCPQ